MTKDANNSELLQELAALMTGHWLTDFANFAALIYQRLPNLNWVGFYFANGDRLRLGPFYGLPACTDILFTRGVCGAAFSQNKTMIVADVHTFPGHISCDPASRSELVIPLQSQGEKFGVLDLDSPSIDRFKQSDAELLQECCRILLAKIPAAHLQSKPWSS